MSSMSNKGKEKKMLITFTLGKKTMNSGGFRGSSYVCVVLSPSLSPSIWSLMEHRLTKHLLDEETVNKEVAALTACALFIQQYALNTHCT